MQEQVEKFDLDRVTNIENNIDAFGKKWEIVRRNRATALLVAKPIPFRTDFVCPEEFQGDWTSFDTLQEQVKIYVVRTWDQADKAKVKAERAALALSEIKSNKVVSKKPKKEKSD